MFHFPGCPPVRLLIHLTVIRRYPDRVSPFGDPRINAYLRLPVAFRSLSRPSSAISAMASTLRSYSLDLLFRPSRLLAPDLLRLSLQLSSGAAIAREHRNSCPLLSMTAFSDLLAFSLILISVQARKVSTISFLQSLFRDCCPLWFFNLLLSFVFLCSFQDAVEVSFQESSKRYRVNFERFLRNFQPVVSFRFPAACRSGLLQPSGSSAISLLLPFRIPLPSRIDLGL